MRVAHHVFEKLDGCHPQDLSALLGDALYFYRCAFL